MVPKYHDTLLPSSDLPAFFLDCLADTAVLLIYCTHCACRVYCVCWTFLTAAVCLEASIDHGPVFAISAPKAVSVVVAHTVKSDDGRYDAEVVIY